MMLAGGWITEENSRCFLSELNEVKPLTLQRAITEIRFGRIIQGALDERLRREIN